MAILTKISLNFALLGADLHEHFLKNLTNSHSFGVLLADQGPVVQNLTMSLVNEMLKFQTLISQICQYFLLKKCEKLLHSFFQQKISVYFVKNSVKH